MPVPLVVCGGAVPPEISPLPLVEVVRIAADVGKHLMVHLMIEVADRSARGAEILIFSGREVAVAALATPHPGVAPFRRRFRY